MISSKNHQLKYAVAFCVIPVLISLLIGLWFFLHISKSVTAQADDPDLIFTRWNISIIQIIIPSLVAGLVALFCWRVFIRNNYTVKSGVFAGLLTVFLCYPVVGGTFGALSPVNGIMGVGRNALWGAVLIAIGGNLLSFWLTYPLGALFGGVIVKRMIKNAPAPVEVFD